MTRQQAENRVAAAGREITVARAYSWLGSNDACFRAGVNSASKWACSVYCPVMRAVYEPTSFYNTLSELVDDQINRAWRDAVPEQSFEFREAA